MKKHPKVHRHGKKWRIKFSFSKQKYVISADSEQECIIQYEQKIQVLQGQGSVENVLDFVQVANAYYESQGCRLKSHAQAYHVIHSFIRDYPFIAHKAIQDITIKDMIAWRNDRTSKVKQGTVRTEMGRLSAVFEYAIHELQIIKDNPLSSIKKPKASTPRKRRVSQLEIEHLMSCCSYQLVRKNLLTPRVSEAPSQDGKQNSSLMSEGNQSNKHQGMLTSTDIRNILQNILAYKDVEAVEIENSLLGTVPSYSAPKGVQKAQPTTGSKLSIATLLKGIKHDGDDGGIFFATQRTKGFVIKMCQMVVIE